MKVVYWIHHEHNKVIPRIYTKVFKNFKNSSNDATELKISKNESILCYANDFYFRVATHAGHEQIPLG